MNLCADKSYLIPSRLYWHHRGVIQSRGGGFVTTQIQNLGKYTACISRLMLSWSKHAKIIWHAFLDLRWHCSTQTRSYNV